MKVLVTGGAGRIGRHVVDELLRRDHTPTIADIAENVQIDGAEYIPLDCAQFDQVRKAVEGHEAVIHLAAVVSPTRDTSERIFQINCGGTYNIYQACAEKGIPRISVASSINALGMRYGIKEVPIRYFPLDEKHPVLCSDPYSFSKKITEEIGAFFWEKDCLSSVSIRIPAVHVIAPGEPIRFDPWKADRSGTVRNLWTWIDARDAARIFVDGIDKPYEGFHVLFANDHVNTAGLPARELAARFFPQVTEFREPLNGVQSLVSCRRAKELLGWEPIYSRSE